MRRLPSWLVSSPHRRPPTAGPPRPYGVHHARRVGDAYTACGPPALGWPFFWDLPFDPDAGVSCPDCALAVRERVSSGGDRDGLPT